MSSLSIAFLNNEYRIAQWGSLYGSPHEAGIDILLFIKDLIETDRIEYFKQKLLLCTLLSDEKEISRAAKPTAPQLNVETGSDIFDLVLDSKEPMTLKNSIESAADSAYCQWGYVINFDAEELEVYRGHNTEELAPDERFYWLEKSTARHSHFHPLKKIYTISFNEIKFLQITTFLQDIGKA